MLTMVQEKQQRLSKMMSEMNEAFEANEHAEHRPMLLDYLGDVGKGFHLLNESYKKSLETNGGPVALAFELKKIEERIDLIEVYWIKFKSDVLEGVNK
jgi:uncharacterized protein Yka (UPF0111/DUF47 family)